MGVSAFGPALHVNADEFARRLRVPTRLPRISEPSSSPNTPERVGEGTEPIDALDVRSSPDDKTSIVDTDHPRPIDVDDFRRWWRCRLIQEAAENGPHRRKSARVAITLAAIALIGSALALKGFAPTPLKGSTVAAKAQNLGGETVDTPADISTMIPAATPVAPEPDPQSKAPPQTADPEFARSVSVREDRTPTATEPGSATAAGELPSSPMDGPVGTAQPSKHPETAIPRAPADTTSALLPMTSERQTLQRMV
jgi:hypothetical protein